MGHVPEPEAASDGSFEAAVLHQPAQPVVLSLSQLPKPEQVGAGGYTWTSCEGVARQIGDFLCRRLAGQSLRLQASV